MPADLTLPGLGPVHHRAYLVESIEDTVARLVEQFAPARSSRSRT